MYNKKNLKEAETRFLTKYPTGFLHPEFEKISKKHKMDQMITMAQESFKKSRFSNPQAVADNMVKIISRSSMVSMFEKPKFRDFVASLSEEDTRKMTNGLKNILHGNQEKGFNNTVDILKIGKLAKWSLVSIIPNYYHPQSEVFVKPTTAKGVIQHFELDDLHYNPTPTWDFYHRYKAIILKMKGAVDDTLSPNNAAFCGFLMMAMDQ